MDLSPEPQVTESAAPQIFLTVGTDHHPFNRMVTYADDLARAFPECDVFIQIGTSDPPAHASWARFVPETEMRKRLMEAAAVVTHGGPATIMAARRAGHVPITVARRGAAGEHVDDHQVSFCRLQAAAEIIVQVDSSDSLLSAVAEALERPAAPPLTPDNRGSVHAFEVAVAQLLAYE